MTEPDAVEETPLKRSQDAIDEAREAAKKVADAEDIEVGDLPAFADSTPGVDHANAFSDGEQDADPDQEAVSRSAAAESGTDAADPEDRATEDSDRAQ